MSEAAPSSQADEARARVGLEVCELSFQRGTKQILDTITFKVEPGEILCVMGMSGCGKTTLLHCIGGLTRPTSGEIWVGDNQIVGMREAALNSVRERMGMVFQYAALFELAVRV